MQECFVRQCDLCDGHTDILWTGNVPLPRGMSLHVSSQSRSHFFAPGILRGCRRRSASPPATCGPLRTEKETGSTPYAIRHRYHGTRRAFGVGATEAPLLQLPGNGAAIPSSEAAGAVVNKHFTTIYCCTRDVFCVTLNVLSSPRFPRNSKLTYLRAGTGRRAACVPCSIVVEPLRGRKEMAYPLRSADLASYILQTCDSLGRMRNIHSTRLQLQKSYAEPA